MKWLYFSIFLLSVLLFAGGPDYESHRIVKAIWDLGHVFLFTGVAYILINNGLLRKYSQFYSLVIVVFASLFIGLVIEGLQLLVGRSFELADVLSDLYGALIGYLLGNFSLVSSKQRISSIFSIVVLLALSFTGLFRVVFDEVKMYEEFPILADFESTFELTRWDVNLAELSISSKHTRHGLRALRVEFLPGEYPDITLQHFPRNWQGYKTITFSLYNQYTKSINIELKVYDKQNIRNGYLYKDRFNKELVVNPGWNDFNIALSDVLTSPADRIMDSQNIKSLSLFLHQTTKVITLYLDSLMLQ